MSVNKDNPESDNNLNGCDVEFISFDDYPQINNIYKDLDLSVEDGSPLYSCYKYLESSGVGMISYSVIDGEVVMNNIKEKLDE